MSEVTLLTGASGFIGRYVLERLLASGARVRVLVRRPERLPEAIRSRVELVAGDIRDPQAVHAAVCGAGTVLHLAGLARAWAADPEEFQSVNVRGVGVLLEAAAGAGVRRLVHVSTILTLPPFKPAPLDGRPARPTLYEETKREGERLVEQYLASGHDAVIVHPTRVYGPGPLDDANTVTRALDLYLRGRLWVRLADGDALSNYVYVDDVAAGILLAASRGRRGAHYLLGGEDASFRGLLELASRLAGVRHRLVPLPPGLAAAVASAAELWGHLSGRCPVTPGWVRVLLEDRRVDISRTRADLGYYPRSLAEGLHLTLAWLARRTAHQPAE